MALAASYLVMTAIPLSALWACLGIGTVGTRLLVVGLIALGVGALPSYWFRGDAAEYLLWIAIPLMQMVIVAPTLLVFRALGYRLVPSCGSLAAER